jgi:hypothetical protein
MRTHISFQTNLKKTQITETPEAFLISGVPVVVDGAVMNGITYPADENEKGLDSLVNRVVTLRHPFDSKGHPIDAYDPQALQNQFSGGVVTKRYKVGKVNLVDINIKKSLLQAQDSGQSFYDRLTNKEEIGVSTGLYTNVVNNTATEQTYNHLAMLESDEEPAGGDATKMKFNGAETMVVNVDEIIAELNQDDSLLHKIANAVKNLTELFANRQKVDDNTTGRGQRDNLNNEVKTMLTREQVINMLKGKGVAVDESHTDAQLTEQLTNSLAAKPEQKGEQVVNADLTDAITKAVNAAVKPLNDQLTKLQANAEADAQAKKAAAVSAILAANSVYTKDELEAMPETVLNKMAAQFVPAYSVNSGNGQFNPQAEDEFKDYSMNAAIDAAQGGK